MAAPDQNRCEPAASRAVIVLFQMGFWIPLIICTYLALVPAPPEHPIFALGDVTLHAGAFVYLSLALVLAQYGIPGTRSSLYVRSFALMLVYGILLELIQSFIPERTAELKDLLVDIVGIGVGLGLATFIAAPLHGFMSRLLGRF